MHLKNKLRNYKQILYMKKHFLFILFIVGFLTSCKSTFTTTKVKSDIKPLTITQIFKNQESADINANTVLAKIKVKYITAKKKQNITAKLRLQKDSIIWISLTAIGGIPVAKMIITPQHIRYYEKLNKTYFDGNFSLLNHWLKANLTFKKLKIPKYFIGLILLILSLINKSFQKIKKNIYHLVI